MTDLRLVAALAIAAMLVVLPPVPWQLQWVVGGLMLLVLPGYAAVAALFPQRPDASYEETARVGWPARAGLTVVASVLFVGIVGAALAAFGALTAVSAVGTLAAVTLLFLVVAWLRRGTIPTDYRADPLAGLSADTVERATGTSGLQSVALLLAVLLLGSTLALAGTSPSVDPYSEAYFADGEDIDVGPDDPSLVAGTDNTLAVTVENHEGVETDYRVVTRLQSVDADGAVTASERLADGTVTLAPGEDATVLQVVDPSLTGERLRLQVLVFTGGSDAESSVEDAELVLRLWVTVAPEGAA